MRRVHGRTRGRRSPSRNQEFPVVLYVALAIHVAESFGLICLVLLHSGRGGGLSDMFGGGLGTTAAGSTVVEKNLDRMIIICSVVFVFTTIALALMLDQG